MNMNEKDITHRNTGHLLIFSMNFVFLNAISNMWEKVGGTGVKAQ